MGRLISQAFHQGTYAHEDYIAAYQDVFGGKTRGTRLIKFVSFYIISLMQGCQDKGVEEALMDYVLVEQYVTVGEDPDESEDGQNDENHVFSWTAEMRWISQTGTA